MRTICKVLNISRSNLLEKLKKSSRVEETRNFENNDPSVLFEVKEVINQRPTYGYRRITALLNRKRSLNNLSNINHKKIYRIMKENSLLLQKFTGKKTRTHDGIIATLKSNTRWCSDAFGIQCWNGDKVNVVFSLDTCDREAINFLATTGGITGEMVRDLMIESLELRFGGPSKRPPSKIQWLSDNGPCYTANETVQFGRNLGFEICTTPSYSPESNGMAEAFVKTFKRDYVWLAAPPFIRKLQSESYCVKQLA